ncbi:MAG: hypothetical protein HOC91_17405 [Nitrospinaceae bacterium]|nr:hypothetical protein [Nitrospinaceae bacterium]MBT3823095.1 hypothetical protein [Nitrospinaceae bacterium]MBT4093323.1 hypothetical protein [Nitrospinaceae bacterium]MBT4432288.1 hypothetical protein [Nitrospinaceae bacterium]MBT5367979.1 hypothetical protein [Nitrospinaceae bacterium]
MKLCSNCRTCGFHVTKIILIAFFFIFATSASMSISIESAQAVSPPAKQISGPKSDKKEPIYITSNRMEAYNKKNLIVFIGEVSAIQGEMEIKSDRLEVYVKKKSSLSATANAGAGGASKQTSTSSQGKNLGGSDPGSVDRLVATGNVLINQGKNKYAAGDRLDYAESKGIAILTGNPRAWEKNNQVIGTKIEIYLREGRTIVYGNKKRRVSVTLYPNEPTNNTAPKTATTGSNGK